MKRMALTCVLAVMGMALVFGVTAADDAKSVKDIMKAANGKGGPWGVISGEIGKKKDKADLEKLVDPSKALFGHAQDLTKTKKPKEKGEDEAWTKATMKYCESCKALADAIEKKDAAAAVKACGTVAGSCKGCHSVFR